MSRKAAFFDIDGTIWNVKNEIPDSTIRAIQMMKEKGNYTFLCSGRARGFIQDPRLLSLGFDGIVSGCGTMIEYGGETIFYRELENSLVEKTIETVRRFGFRVILEGKEFTYLDDDELKTEKHAKRLKEELGDKLLPILENWGKWEISKLTVLMDPQYTQTCFDLLKNDYDFMIHNPTVAELVPKGFHKGTGIRKVCELLDIAMEDTYAFGDGANDLGMFAVAGTAIAMGDGAQIAKTHADYVTTNLMDDGIWNACKHYDLI